MHDGEAFLRRVFLEQRWESLKEEALYRAAGSMRSLMQKRHKELCEALQHYIKIAVHIPPIVPPPVMKPDDIAGIRRQEHFRYLHLKAFLCEATPLWCPPDELWKALPVLPDGAHKPCDWYFLFEGLPDDEVYVRDLSRLAEALIVSLKASGPGVEEVVLAPAVERAVRERCIARSVGCTLRCPFCGTTCQHSLYDRHTTHSCSRHSLAATCPRQKISPHQMLWSCDREFHNSSVVFTGSTESERLTFAEYCRIYHPTWFIPFLPSTQAAVVASRVCLQRRWLSVGRLIQDLRQREIDERHFPRWWSADLFVCCQFCCQPLQGREGKAVKLSCGHRQHEDCYRTFVKQRNTKCLVCHRLIQYLQS
eukprot:NODE_1624_length_1467_cov_24.620592_g1466_i0.p1 GENE.NODE_1624_length_1467_cov_24.620592_g1466_i0~~NODE_1624_length_1467_cov_24.620592_g1466_i0.p1  ORF type:complete len:426 (+),score=46.03 NODE_1624_length_1467_cov_24.620592_g1466_i0:186-1280(+)